MAKPALATVITLSPASQNITQNQTVNFDINIDSVSNLNGISIHLRYDPGYLAYATSTDGGFLSGGGAMGINLTATSTVINATTSDLVIGMVRDSADGVSASATSTLLHLSFQASAAATGVSSLNFYSSQCHLTDPSVADIPASWNGGSLNLSPSDIQVPNITILSPTNGTEYFTSSSTITLTGTASDNGGISYVTWQNVTASTSGTAAGTANWSISNISLTAPTTTLTVIAHDAAGNTASDTLAVYLDQSAPVMDISGIATALSASSIKLEWAVASDAGVSGLAGYRIYRNGTSPANLISTLSGNTFTDSNLSASTAYTYYIYAIDNAGNTSSNFITLIATTKSQSVSGGGGGGGGGGSASVIDSTPPSAVNNFQAVPGASQTTLHWANPIDADFAGVLILRTESSSQPTCPTLSAYSVQVLRGRASDYTDVGLNSNLKYCYAIFAYDGVPNYSAGVTTIVQPGPGTTAATSTMTSPASQTSPTSQGASQGGSLANASGSEVDAVTASEAAVILGNRQFVQLTEINKKVYDKVVAQAPSGQSEQAKRALAYFIQTGTPSTLPLGAGERGGSAGSFLAAFGRLPQSQADWQDVLKIANGRWPQQRNSSSEALAVKTFQKIYLRTPDRTRNRYDDNAVVVITYGLRPAKRNMASETAAIKSFKYIYNRAPSRSNDWDIVRAISYSGAKR